jgi:ribosomal-protein-alanine N-acetyltransferase
MEIYTERLLIIPCTEESYVNFSDRYKMGPHIESHLDELKKDMQMKGFGRLVCHPSRH